MEIDLGTIIIGFIALMICTLPFIIMRRNRKKREKALLESLSEIASHNNCQIDQHEVFSNSIIGLDEKRDCVFFYSKSEDSEVKEFIDLSDIQRCSVINTNRTLKSAGGDQTTIIDKLELSFIPSKNSKSEIQLTFFDAALDPQLAGEFQSIQTWSKEINKRLK